MPPKEKSVCFLRASLFFIGVAACWFSLVLSDAMAGGVAILGPENLSVAHPGDAMRAAIWFTDPHEIERIHAFRLSISDYTGKCVLAKKIHFRKKWYEFWRSVPQAQTQEGMVCYTLHLPIQQLGVFRAIATFVNEAGETAAINETSFAIIPDVTLRDFRVNSPFGIGSYFAVRFNSEALEKGARLQALLGAAYDRDELLWSLCEPERGQWKWEKFDRTVRACRKNHILILGLLDYWSPWVEPLSEESYEGFANYVKHVVSRYKPSGAFAQENGWKDGYGIRHWEIWNEPATFWFGTGGQFGRLLKVASQAAKEADPHCMVFFANSDPKFDSAVIDVAGSETFDGVAPHYYCPPRSPEDGQVDKQMRSTVTFFRDRGINGPLWITEMGWPTDNTLPKQQLQAYFLVRSFVLALASGMDKVLWYNFMNDQPDKTREEFGLLNREDFTPKIAYGAYAAMVHFLEGWKYGSQLPLGKDIRCYLFSLDTGARAVVWSTAGEGSLHVNLPKQIMVYDIMGNPIDERKRIWSFARRSRCWAIPLRQDPVYVDAPQLEVSALAELLRRGTVTGIAPFTVNILPLEGGLADFPPVRVKVTNAGRQAISGKVRLIPPPEWEVEQEWKAFERLEPAASAVLDFQFSRMDLRADNQYPVGVKLVCDDGSGTEKHRVLTENVAAHGSPIIDGDLSDWHNARFVYLNDPSQAVGLVPWMDWNLSARVATLWDEENFCFGAVVTDNVFFQPYEGTLVWQGDSFQLGFDCANTKGTVPDDPGHYVYGLSLTEHGPEAFRWKGGNLKAGRVPQIELAVTRPDKIHTIYEARIPKDLLRPLEFVAGSRFGFTFLLNDNDGGGRRGWMEWTPGIGTGNDASFFTQWQLVK
jgi:hypothetical protein